jgi:hypothetical protein
MIVQSHQIKRAGLVNKILFRIGIAQCAGNGAGIIQLLYNAHQFPADSYAGAVKLLADLVANAPHKNRGVVTIAQYLVLQIFYMPFVPV